MVCLFTCMHVDAMYVDAMYTVCIYVYTCALVQFGCILLPGCGKTTLLDLLTGRRNSGEQKVANPFGTICFNASCMLTW